jgi:hypothetical protein
MANQDAQAQKRAAVEKVLNRIASDPGYRQSLLDDPVAALEVLVGAELDPAEDVAGYARPVECPPAQTCSWSCKAGGTCGQKSCQISRFAEE